MKKPTILIAKAELAAALVAARAGAGPPQDRMSVSIERKTCQAADGVTIVYSAAGAGEVALVFVHGGLADRSFFDGQLKTFANQYRVIALDLAGHGESSANRTKWGIPQFGADVKAVVDAEKLKRVILFGNSLGGPTALEAALLLPDRVLGVVGIDTFHSLMFSMTEEEARSTTFSPTSCARPTSLGHGRFWGRRAHLWEPGDGEIEPILRERPSGPGEQSDVGFSSFDSFWLATGILMGFNAISRNIGQ